MGAYHNDFGLAKAGRKQAAILLECFMECFIAWTDAFLFYI
jgi:hypothetical protein